MNANRLPRRALLTAAVCAVLGIPQIARANTFIVGSGSCTLGDAISASATKVGVGNCSAGSGNDDIILVANVALAAALPPVKSNIAFSSSGGIWTITGDGSHRLFFVGDDTHAPTVSFTNLTLKSGVAQGGAGNNGAGGGAGLGGAVFVYDGSLSVSSVTFSNNSAAGGASNGTSGANLSNYAQSGTGGNGGGGMFGAGGGVATSLGSSSTSLSGLPGFSGGFGGGGGGGGTSESEFGGGSGGGGGSLYTSGGMGGTGASGVTVSSAGAAGTFGGGGGGGGGGNISNAAQPGGVGGFGGGGGGGAGSCSNSGCFLGAANGAAGGFGGGGGAGGSVPGYPAGTGGNGGFGGGGGAHGFGSNLPVGGLGGFGGGNYVEGGGGGGAGFGGAIFVRSGTLDVRNSSFSTNSVAHGTGYTGSNGLGKAAAIFVLPYTTNANGNNQGMPTAIPSVTGCNNSFSGSIASDAGSTSRDNADTFGADRVGLELVSCTDRIFADGFGVP